MSLLFLCEKKVQQGKHGIRWRERKPASIVCWWL